ncbi:MAG: putative glyoxylase CFP32 [Gemmatimonadota bacterium]|nr:MAG: putative glyoxylase CFP32 [Gemmatimonadota bacterium]
MSETTVKAPGTFCWSEVCTADLAAAKEFYGGLFGWTTKDNTAGPGIYSLLHLGNEQVGGMYELVEQQKEMGVPPHWLGYVLVEDVNEATERAQSLGGTVVMGPMDVMEMGRMALLQDPTGAVFALWQALTHTGGGEITGHGSVCWHELVSTDRVEATAFYAALFGWELESGPGEMEYTLFMNDEKPTAGCMQRTEEMGPVPSHWLTYFNVDDTDASADKASALGGRVVHPPTDIPGVGRFALLADHAGAIFGVMKLSGPAEPA